MEFFWQQAFMISPGETCAGTSDDLGSLFVVDRTCVYLRLLEYSKSSINFRP